MKLDFIPLNKLVIAKANMRGTGRAPDVSDILPPVRTRGILVPMLVRPRADSDGGFEIVAGRRRFTAATKAASEGGPDRPAPCAILDDADDADAIEASMIENLARLDPDEVSQWESFVKLAKAGRSVEEIAQNFAFEPKTVKRILALGNLLPRIRTLYRNGEIDPATVRHLTLASKSQQTAWLALHDDESAWCPTGHQLKAWLFGGTAIKTAHALFDVEASGASVIADLFGEDPLFADSDAFWTAQMAEVAARKAAYIEAGWSDVVILERGDRFRQWDYCPAPKRQGGRVYIEVRDSGEVDFHEGYLTAKEADARAKGEKGEAPVKVQRPEVTSAINTYIDLHRHAAVRAELAKHGGIALRALVAHVIAGADHYRVEIQSQVCAKDEVQESVETCAPEVLFDERRRAVLAVLGFGAEDATVTGRSGRRQFAPVFARLLELPDPVVLEIVAIVMGETLMAGSEAVEMIGVHLGVDMAAHWAPDAAFWNLVRDREVLGKMVAEVAGDEVAAANGGEKAKALKAIITDHLEGANGRAKVAPWVPKWMAFPPAPYTARGGVGSVEAEARMLHILALDAANSAETDAKPDPQPGRGAAVAAAVAADRDAKMDESEDGEDDASPQRGTSGPDAVDGEAEMPPLAV